MYHTREIRAKLTFIFFATRMKVFVMMRAFAKKWNKVADLSLIFLSKSRWFLGYKRIRKEKWKKTEKKLWFVQNHKSECRCSNHSPESRSCHIVYFWLTSAFSHSIHCCIEWKHSATNQQIQIRSKNRYFTIVTMCSGAHMVKVKLLRNILNFIITHTPHQRQCTGYGVIVTASYIGPACSRTKIV